MALVPRLARMSHGAESRGVVVDIPGKSGDHRPSRLELRRLDIGAAGHGVSQARLGMDEVEKRGAFGGRRAAHYGVIGIALDMRHLGLLTRGKIALRADDDAAGNGTLGAGVARLGSSAGIGDGGCAWLDINS